MWYKISFKFTQNTYARTEINIWYVILILLFWFLNTVCEWAHIRQVEAVSAKHLPKTDVYVLRQPQLSLHFCSCIVVITTCAWSLQSCFPACNQPTGCIPRYGILFRPDGCEPGCPGQGNTCMLLIFSFCHTHLSCVQIRLHSWFRVAGSTFAILTWSWEWAPNSNGHPRSALGSLKKMEMI